MQLVREGCPIENYAGRHVLPTRRRAKCASASARRSAKAAREDPALGEQVMALSRASISTLHRFCGNLLREHFQALHRPGFRIGDEQECGVLSHQAMEDAI